VTIAVAVTHDIPRNFPSPQQKRAVQGELARGLNLVVTAAGRRTTNFQEESIGLGRARRYIRHLVSHDIGRRRTSQNSLTRETLNNPRCHRRRPSLQCFVFSGEIVEREEKVLHRGMMLSTLAVGVRQPSEAAIVHPHREN